MGHLHRLRVRASKLHGCRGQSVVELALLLPVLLMCSMGAIDFGRGLNAWVVMQNAAREGAFYAAKVCPYTSTCSNVTTVVETEAAPVLNSATVSNLAVTGPCTVDGQRETTDEVKVSFNFKLVTPLFGANSSLPMSVVATAPEGPGTTTGSSGGTC